MARKTPWLSITSCYHCDATRRDPAACTATRPTEGHDLPLQLYGPFFKIISYAYNANATLGNLRILPGTNRRATPTLHDLRAYADLVAPRGGRGGARWLDAAVKRRKSLAAVAQLALPAYRRARYARSSPAASSRSNGTTGV